VEADLKKRAAFKEQINRIPTENLLFIDKSGIDHGITQARACAKKGQVIVGKRSGKHLLRTNIIAGLCNKKCVAPVCVPSTCNTEVFNTWVEKALIKVLKPGRMVTLSNASFHKSKRTQELIESVGCKFLFLPPYSPVCNPIEKFWAKMKTFIGIDTETSESFF
jgi:hypothetical protein